MLKAADRLARGGRQVEVIAAMPSPFTKPAIFRLVEKTSRALIVH